MAVRIAGCAIDMRNLRVIVHFRVSHFRLITYSHVTRWSLSATVNGGEMERGRGRASESLSVGNGGKWERERERELDGREVTVELRQHMCGVWPNFKDNVSPMHHSPVSAMNFRCAAPQSKDAIRALSRFVLACWALASNIHLELHHFAARSSDASRIH